MGRLAKMNGSDRKVETVSTTYESILAFMNMAEQWIKRTKAPTGESPARTKFHYAIRKMVRRSQQQIDLYNEAAADIRTANAATYQDGDKKGVIIRGVNGSPEFTPELELKALQEIRKLYRTTHVMIDPFMAQDVPSDLTDDEREAFAGFVLPESGEADS